MIQSLNQPVGILDVIIPGLFLALLFFAAAVAIKFHDVIRKKLNMRDIKPKNDKASGALPLSPDHICFDTGHTMYEVCRIDNGRSVYGEHKCSRCGHVEPFQFDYQ
jgi:hypothetical protein